MILFHNKFQLVQMKWKLLLRFRKIVIWNFNKLNRSVIRVYYQSQIKTIKVRVIVKSETFKDLTFLMRNLIYFYKINNFKNLNKNKYKHFRIK